MTGLIMATELEAAPLIGAHGFRQIGQEPFPVYKRGDRILVLSGMGKERAAAGTAWLIGTFHPQRVVNAGAAGRAGSRGRLGELFEISQVTEGDPAEGFAVENRAYGLPVRGDLPRATLATYGKPVKTESERLAASRLADLVDMEGVAVVRACVGLGTPVHLLKYITDCFSGDDIVRAILQLRDAACQQICDGLF